MGETIGVICSANHCTDDVAAIGHVTFRVDSLVNAVPADEEIAFALPLCRHHAKLLRMQNQLVEFLVT